MRNLIFSLIIFISTFTMAAVPGRKVDLNTLSPTVQKELLTKFPNLATDQFSYADLDDALRFLMANSQFDSVEVVLNVDGTVQFKTERTKRVAKINIIGNQLFVEGEILQFLGVNTQDAFNLGALAEGGEKIRLAYKEKGYHDTVVDIAYPSIDNGDVILEVRINEGVLTEIDKIVIESGNSKLNKALYKVLDNYEGNALTEVSLAEIQQAAVDFFAAKRYLQSSLGKPEIELFNNDKKARIKFKIENTKSYSVEFEGHQFFSTGKLEDIIDLDHFSSSSPQISLELSNKVKNQYLAQGFSKVELNNEDTETDTSHNIKILIKEGLRTKIADIDFTGKVSKGAGYYKNKAVALAGETTKKGFYFRDEIDSALKSMVVELQNSGYLQAKIISTRAQFNKEKDKVTVTVNMDEGPQTLIDRIVFDGNANMPLDQLSNLVALKTGEPLNLPYVEAAIGKLKTHYRNSGFLEMALLNEKDNLVDYNSDNTLAKITFKIYEGPKIRVGSILIEGNSFTKSSVILKELEFKVGDILTPNGVEESTRRLQRLGFFSSLEIRTLEEKSQISDRTVIVKVAERDPGLFNFGAGLNSDRQLTSRGFVGLSYRNLMGTGRGASGRIEGHYNIADVKYPEFKLTLAYLEPYILNTRTRGRITHTRSQFVTDYDKREVSDVRQTTWSLEQDITSHVFFSYDLWSLASVRDFRIRNDAPPITQEIGTTGPTLDLDFRDHPFNPTTGTFTRLNVEYADPELLQSSRTINYIRSNASFTHYQPLRQGTWVWANNLRAGRLENLSRHPEGGVPYDKKGFVLGGRSTIRGFEAGTHESFPNDTDLGSDKFKLTKAATYSLIKSELRFPIYNNFSGAVFYDGGQVKLEEIKLPYGYRDAAGFGFRIGTPVGPVNFEWAWKLNRLSDRDESPMRFHFSIGTF